MSITSGWFSAIAFAIFCSRIVLPALGGEVISARWPFPIGHSRSMIRVSMQRSLVSRSSFSCG